MLRYEIVEFDSDAHEFHVRLTIEADETDLVRLTMPAWIPGSYLIRDFARQVHDLVATDADGLVPAQKVDKQNWVIKGRAKDVVVDYRVYAYDLSVRAAYLDRTRAYFNGTCLFLYPAGKELDWELTFHKPSGVYAQSWRVATALPAHDVDVAGFGRYRGHGIEQLYDAPVEIADFESVEYAVDGVAHQMVISDGGSFDATRIGKDLAQICGEHAGMFEELPVQQYLFLTLATADGYGGLEHAESTSLICKRSDLPRVGLKSADEGYRQFLGLCSHEYFHLWNVKRIRPERFVDPDLGVETYTELLWAFEGITSYYDDLALVRSEVISAEDYLAAVAMTVTRVMRGCGRRRQSIAESSFDAWTKFYKQDENASNAIVSYYAKGALVALGLDVTLRQRSDGRYSLDDLMRELWKRFGRTGVGVPERGIEGVVESMLGASLSDFFTAYVYGTQELPLADWFGYFGIGYRLRPSLGPKDRGGSAATGAPRAPFPSLGANYEQEAAGVRLVQVTAGGAAQMAGLSPGDLLVAIDGEKVSADNLTGLLQRARESVVVHFFHRDRLRAEKLAVVDAPADTCELWVMADDAVDVDALCRRNSWWQSNRRKAI